MARPFIIVQLLLLLAAATLCLGADKRVRVLLHKKSHMQNGDPGQPLTSYFAQMDVGTPPKTFKMLLDVNAHELWLPHYLKADYEHPRLNYKKGYTEKDSSSASKPEREPYKIAYKDCWLVGELYSDVFQFNDVAESLGAVRWKQRFLAMKAASSEPKLNGADGVLALNPWASTQMGSDLITTGILRQNLTGQVQFALALADDEDTQLGGELTIGMLNDDKFKGDLKYHPVVSQHEWAVGLESVRLGASSLAGCSDHCTAVLSTTINDIYAPTRAIQELLKLLGFSDAEHNFKSSSLYEIDCLKVADAPQLTFVIGGLNYALPPTSYIKRRLDGTVHNKSFCYIALLPNGSRDKWELGTNFLAHYYTVFDINKVRVAFGTLV